MSAAALARPNQRNSTLRPYYVPVTLTLSEDAPLHFKDPAYSDLPSTESLAAEDVVAPKAASPLEIAAMLRIIREVAAADSGSATYSSVATDQPEVGLAFGLVHFTQSSGRLGNVLRLTEQRDAQVLPQAFGAQVGELLAVTTAPSPEQRMQPIGGLALTSSLWIERFRKLGELPACQAAQVEEAIEGQFRPMLPLTAALGLQTDRSLAIAFDRVVTMGIGAGLRWTISSCGPLRSTRQRAFAMSTLGYPDYAAFQAANGLVADGIFNAETHAYIAGALRQQGLIPVPGAGEMCARLVAGSTGPARKRLKRLLHSEAFSDVVMA